MLNIIMMFAKNLHYFQKLLNILHKIFEQLTGINVISDVCCALNLRIYFFTARRRYASAVLGVVILSVRPSVTRVLCD